MASGLMAVPTSMNVHTRCTVTAPERAFTEVSATCPTLLPKPSAMATPRARPAAAINQFDSVFRAFNTATLRTSSRWARRNWIVSAPVAAVSRSRQAPMTAGLRTAKRCAMS